MNTSVVRRISGRPARSTSILLLVVLATVPAGCRSAPEAVLEPDPTSIPPEAQVTLRTVDGGPRYYDRFANGLPTSESYFPVAVWFESLITPEDVSVDREMGINTYVELTANSDLSLATTTGMAMITSSGDQRTHGFLATDEPDMWAGAGEASWTGNDPGEGDICSPPEERCGYTVMDTLLQHAPPGVMTYANFGKGVAFWASDEQAARFLDLTDLASVSTYWFTDPGICGEGEGGMVLAEGRPLDDGQCRLAANYGWTVQRARSLVHPPGSKPVWHFVEVGHPFVDPGAPTITGPQIRAAVWSGIIHGARGVIYFNHSFGGDCTTQHVLRDACGDPVRADVIALNRQIQALAPVLNAPFVDGLLTVTHGVDAAVKWHGNSLTILAGANAAGPRTVNFTLACPLTTTAQVIGEDRQLAVTAGNFTDTFDDADAVHLYQLDGEACDIG